MPSRALPSRICPAVLIAQQSKLKFQNVYPIHHYEGLRYAKGASQGRDRRRAEGAQVSAPGIGPKYRRAARLSEPSPEARGGSREPAPAGPLAPLVSTPAVYIFPRRVPSPEFSPRIAQTRHTPGLLL